MVWRRGRAGDLFGIGGALLLGATLLLSLPAESGGGAKARTGRRLALIVANSIYDFQTLQLPVEEVMRWVASLEAVGFEVDVCSDCGLRQMKEKLTAFEAKIAPGDEAFFYYSGHGIEERGRNLLLPVDVDLQGCGPLRDQSVSQDEVLEVMRRAEVKVMLLEPCRSPSLSSCPEDSRPGALAPLSVTPPGTLIAYSSRPSDEIVHEGWCTSFSHEALPVAFQPDRPLQDALLEAESRVFRSTGGSQDPLIRSSLSPASYVLRPGPPPASTGQGEGGPSGEIGGPTGRVYVAQEKTAGEMRFVGLSGGVFDMGSPEGVGERHEHPQHRVRVSAFAMAESEVTQAQWSSAVRAAQAAQDPDAVGLKVEPSSWSGAQNPVDSVSWCNAARFANALSRLEGRSPAYTVGPDCEKGGEVAWDRAADGFRLPTEAEWEYAGRAGTRSTWSFGEEVGQICRYANILDRSGKAATPEQVWCEADCDDGYAKVAPVCSFAKNPWGLCDLHGNVFELTWDWYQGTYELADVNDPTGPSSGGHRVLRGGAWHLSHEGTRAAWRGKITPAGLNKSAGFRLALPVPASDR